MAKRLVAADASPLIGLAAAGAFGLLKELIDRVTVTVAVRDEVLAGRDLTGARELKAAVREGWIRVVRNPAGFPAFPELGPGEATTLALASRHRGDCLVLMDEPLGRARAAELGVAVTGLAGILLAAKRARIVKKIRPFFERLEVSDFRISNELIQAVLQLAAEA